MDIKDWLAKLEQGDPCPAMIKLLIVQTMNMVSVAIIANTVKECRQICAINFVCLSSSHQALSDDTSSVYNDFYPVANRSGAQPIIAAYIHQGHCQYQAAKSWSTLEKKWWLMHMAGWKERTFQLLHHTASDNSKMP